MRFILLIGFLLGLASCSSYTCDDFRTGTFRYADEVFKDYIIIRDSLTQVERYTFQGKEVEDTYEIYWQGPCSYTMVIRESSDPELKYHTKYDTIHARIREITDRGYIFHTLLHGEEILGEMILED